MALESKFWLSTMALGWTFSSRLQGRLKTQQRTTIHSGQYNEQLNNQFDKYKLNSTLGIPLQINVFLNLMRESNKKLTQEVLRKVLTAGVLLAVIIN
jgi:hypothetical protein